VTLWGGICVISPPPGGGGGFEIPENAPEYNHKKIQLSKSFINFFVRVDFEASQRLGLSFYRSYAFL